MQLTENRKLSLLLYYGDFPYNQKFRFACLEVHSGEQNSFFQNVQKKGWPPKVYSHF